MPVRATISKTGSSLSESEIKTKDSDIVSEIRALLNRANPDELDQVQELVSLKRQGADLIGANSGSVELLLWCREPAGLKRLHEWLVNGRVQDIVKTLFNRLMKTTRETRIPVDVDWKEEDHDRCVKYFHTWTGK